MVTIASTATSGCQCERERGQRGAEDAQQRAEGRGLDARGHEGGHRRRRALVDVGRPHVEGHARDLEAEADEQQGRAEHGERDRLGGSSATARATRSSEVLPLTP